MPDAIGFSTLFRRLQGGDHAAAEELCRDYGQALRVAVRARLTDPTMRRQVDSGDICQSVWVSFFGRVAAGEFSFSEPGQLLTMLARLARCKVASKARYHNRKRRDARREVEYTATACDQPGPEQLADARDLLDAVRLRLSGEEWAIAERRGAGLSWTEIAAELGGTAESRRKQLTRALTRCHVELGDFDS